jgi:nucleotide-binding universal stress UspA family protein
MTFKHLIVHLDGSARTAERLDLAVKLAQRFGARLTGLFAQGEAPGLKLRAPRRASQAEDLSWAAALFETKFGGTKLESDFWKVPSGEPDPGGVAAHFCRYADLAILGQADPEEPRVPEDLVSKVLIESGRPVLLVPAAGRFEDVGRRVVVEWSGSRESARALGDAIPLMRQAEAVHVLDVRARDEAVGEDDEPALEVVRHLEAHGIRAHAEPTYLAVREAKGRGLDALDVLLNRSSDLGADLVVMGARGRHGVPFPTVGRTARRSLEEITAPVLLLH